MGEMRTERLLLLFCQKSSSHLEEQDADWENNIILEEQDVNFLLDLAGLWEGCDPSFRNFGFTNFIFWPTVRRTIMAFRAYN
jgi:hypothetical protein